MSLNSLLSLFCQVFLVWSEANKTQGKVMILFVDLTVIFKSLWDLAEIVF